MLSTLPSGLVVPQALAGQAVEVGAAGGITQRVREGDPEVGWRGDPNMMVVGDRPDHVEVWGVYQPPEGGEEQWYLAARVNAREAQAEGRDWRREIIERLRDGDWQNPVSVAQRVKESRIVDAARKKAERRERMEETADRVAYALRRELGHHHGGMQRRLH